MIRKGRFAIWNNVEYELFSYQRQYYLQTRNQLALLNGFVKSPKDKDVFIKEVDVKELEDAYEIISYVMILSYRFAVEGYNDETGTVALVTNNPFVQKKINVRPYGKDEFIIEIPYGEVEIIEERIPILGFEKQLTQY